MEEEQDIQSDIVEQKQLRDAQENQEFDRDMDAYRRGRNLTDEQRKKVLLDNARKRQQVEQEKQLLGSRILDNIGDKFTEFGSSVMEAAQEDPDTWTDDAIRIGLGGLKNVGTVLGAPGIKQGLQLVGAPAYYVGRGLGYGLEKAGVDPRYGHILGEVGEWFIPGYGMYKAAGKIVKGANTLDIARMLEKTAQPAYAKSISPVSEALNPERLARIKTLKTNLLRKIDDGYIEEIVEQGDNVIYPPGSKEADILASTQALGPGETSLPKVRTGKTQKLTNKESLAQRKSIFEGAAITNVEELDRTASALVQRRGGTLSGIEFKKWNKEAIEDLQKTYKHITAGELNAHHNNIVKSGVSLHEGRTGPESSLIESWLINKGVASGDSPLNNNLIPEQVHGLVHKWLNERIGSKYLTGLIGELNSPLRKRWESLPIDHPDVKRVVEQYADYVNGATERTAELMQAYYQIWGPESKITEEALDTILKKLNITELEYSELVKPGLSGKDARMFAQGYGPKKIEVTWADGTTETMYERLSREINDDPIFAAQLDELNAKQVKVSDFSNEPTSPTPAQIRRQGWAKEIEDLEYKKTVGKLSKVEKQRLQELRNLMFYGQGLPLLRNIRYGGGPFKGTQNLTEQFNPRNPKIQKTIKKSNKNNQGKLDI